MASPDCTGSQSLPSLQRGGGGPRGGGKACVMSARTDGQAEAASGRAAQHVPTKLCMLLRSASSRLPCLHVPPAPAQHPPIDALALQQQQSVLVVVHLLHKQVLPRQEVHHVLHAAAHGVGERGCERGGGRADARASGRAWGAGVPIRPQLTQAANTTLCTAPSSSSGSTTTTGGYSGSCAPPCCVEVGILRRPTNARTNSVRSGYCLPPSLTMLKSYSSVAGSSLRSANTSPGVSSTACSWVWPCTNLGLPCGDSGRRVAEGAEPLGSGRARRREGHGGMTTRHDAVLPHLHVPHAHGL